MVDGLEIDGTRVDIAPAQAARADVVELVRVLIRRGASVNARDAFGRAPIHQAISSDMYDVAGTAPASANSHIVPSALQPLSRERVRPVPWAAMLLEANAGFVVFARAS